MVLCAQRGSELASLALWGASGMPRPHRPHSSSAGEGEGGTGRNTKHVRQIQRERERQEFKLPKHGISLLISFLRQIHEQQGPTPQKPAAVQAPVLRPTLSLSP